MQKIPKKIEEALAILDQMEAMVQAMYRYESDLMLRSTAHALWADQVRLAWRDKGGRARVAALIVDGPMEQRSDGLSGEPERRQRALVCALLEAAIYEIQESARAQACARERTQDNSCDLAVGDGVLGTQAVQEVLRDWLKLGGRRSQEKSPLTEIGRMVDRSCETAEASVKTRLGLLVPFWSSLTLSRHLCSVPIDSAA